MSAGPAVIVFLVIVIGAVFGCSASYHEGRFNGYLKGYAAGLKAEQRSAEEKISAIRRSTEQVAQEVTQRGQAAQSTIDYLYERAQQEVEQLDPQPPAPSGGTEQS